MRVARRTSSRSCPPAEAARFSTPCSFSLSSGHLLERRAFHFRSRAPSPQSLPRGRRLILGEEKGPEVDQGDLERRRPFSRGTSGSNPSSSRRESIANLTSETVAQARPARNFGSTNDVLPSKSETA